MPLHSRDVLYPSATLPTPTPTPTLTPTPNPSQVPVLKFYLSVSLDLVLFLSLTFLSHPKYYTIFGWTPWEEASGEP